jgi:hypothetical protein
MLARLRAPGTRIALGASAALALLLGASSALFVSASNHHTHATPAASRVFSPSIVANHGAVRTGEMHLASLHVATPAELAAAAASAKPVPTDRPLKTVAQQAAYAQWAKTHQSALPQSTGGTMATKQAPSFVGGGTIPELVNSHDGIDYTQSGCSCFPPDQALAAAPGYVFQGVNNLLEVNSPSTYAVLFGPWTAATFFGAVHPTGSFADPQITFDAERAVYLVSWLEVVSCGSGCLTDFIDLAISKTSSPSPLGNWDEYRIPAVAGTFCDYETLGYDYWGTYVSCVAFGTANPNPPFFGNYTFLFNTNGLLAGSLGTYFFIRSIPSHVSGNPPAYRLSPLIEDGVPQAEWIIATDAGLLGPGGVTSSNLTLCALTNTRAMTGGLAPTVTCDFNPLPLAYDDPANASQPGSPNSIYPGFGTKQVAYRNGRIQFALPMLLTCGGNTVDGIVWYSVDPQLTTIAAHNPQWVNAIVSAYSDAGYWCFSNVDTYLPTLGASNEGDFTISANFSGSALVIGESNVFPSIVYTGRQSVDAPGTVGQGTGHADPVIGSAANQSSRFGDYSNCALVTNLVSRGTMFCAGEYIGADVTDLWNTFIYQVRMQ